MSQNKPFDLLVFESPYEYNDLCAIARLEERITCVISPNGLPQAAEFQRRYMAIIEGVKTLARVCMAYEIPVRCRTHGETDWLHSTDKHKVAEDELIKPFFSGCDYRGDFNMEFLESIGTQQRARIIVSGGFFSYEETNNHLMTIIAKLGMNPDEVENLRLGDKSRRYAFVCGCVASTMERLYKSITSKPREALIYADSASTVSLRSTFDPLSLYLLYRVVDNIPLIVERVDRKHVIPF